MVLRVLEELHNSQNVNLQTTKNLDYSKFFCLFTIFILFFILFIGENILKKNCFLILIFIFLTSCFNINKTNYLIDSVIFIDPGHGGNDNGTSYLDVFEDELNLKLSTILYEMILDDGGICYLSRVSDYDLSSMYAKNHKIEDLKKRVQYIDSLNTTLFISLHLNYYSSSKVNGIQVFYQKQNQKSKELAIFLQDILNVENQRKKQCKVGDYFILNNTTSLGVLIEYGFLSSEYDRQRLLDDNYLNHLAKLIKSSISEYLKNKLKY